LCKNKIRVLSFITHKKTANVRCTFIIYDKIIQLGVLLQKRDSEICIVWWRFSILFLTNQKKKITNDAHVWKRLFL